VSEEQDRLAQRLRRVRAAVRERALLERDPGSVLPPPPPPPRPPVATLVGTPMPVAHAANALAREASRERTNSVAPRSAAVTAVARADPPVPTTSHRSPL
jgi:hypothetical protein